MNAVCEVHNCDKKVQTRKLCMAHYRRLLRNGGAEVSKKIQCKPIVLNTKINSLTIIKEIEAIFTNNGVKIRMVLCVCDCGTSKEIPYHPVLEGKTKSCGCKQGRITHGLSWHSQIRAIHNGMKQRCYNKNNPNYKYYGAKGVTVCDEWLTFEGFAKDMLVSYVSGLSIERSDPFGNYCKENCLWIPKSEQGINKRKSVLITFNGVTQNVSRWAVDYGIDRSTFHRKLKSGISFEQIIGMLP